MQWMRSVGFAVVLMLIGAALLPPAPVLALESGIPAAAEAARRLLPAPYDDGAGSEAAAASPPEPEGGTDRLIVKYKDRTLGRAETVGRGRLQALSARGGVALSHLRRMSGDGQLFRLPKKLSLQEAQAVADRLALDPEVEYAVPDRVLYPMLTPNDTSYPSQWDLKSPADNEIAGSNLAAAWELSTGAASVTVGVIDTGIVSHGDLQGRILPGYNFISDPAMAGNGIGRSADPSDLGDWSSNGDGSVSSPSSWHGSHVTGTIAATTNNGAGVAGINWQAKILPVRVLGHGGGYWSDVADGMRWAAGLPVPGVPANANPARVLNLSLGGSGACDSATQSTIDEVVAAGVVVVVAAGNSSADAASFTPASCNGVITVAALARSGARSSYSNYGAQVEIAAPGDSILSTLNSGSTTPIASPEGDVYRQYSGTSMATPHVAGVASLLLSVSPSLSPAQVLATLQSSARPFPSGTASDCTTSSCGAGILDAYQAVRSLITNQPIAAASPSLLRFDAFTGQPAPPAQSVGIELYNAPGLSWSASSNASWLRVTPTVGSSGTTLTVSVDSTGLPAASHSGLLTIEVEGALNSPLTIPVSLTLKQILDLKAQLPTPVANHALAAVGEKVYVIGGEPAGNLVQIYDTVSNTWSAGASKPTAAFGINAAVIGGKIYVPGGRYSNTSSTALEIYDPSSNQWSSGAPLPAARYAYGLEAFDGKLYMMGGFEQGRSTNTTYAYDPASDSWSRKADIDYLGRPWLGTGVANGRIYAFGGWDGFQVSSAAFSYDPATDIWWPVKNMNRSRLKFATAVVAGKIYAFGGTNVYYNSLDKLSDAVVYDPASNIWSDLPVLLNQARDEVKAVSIGTTVYLMGGRYPVSVPNSHLEPSAVNESYSMLLPVNGACGSAHGKAFASAPVSNLCASGTPGPVTGAPPWQWSCAGLNGGTTASCSAGSTTPLSITNDSQQQGFLGIHYSLELSASGGLAPYLWTLSQASLPMGFYYDPNLARIYGVTWIPGNYSFIMYVTDAAGIKIGKSFSLSVTSPPALVPRSPGFYFGRIQDAYSFIADGDSIRLSGSFQFKENLALNRNLKLDLEGGYSDDLSTRGGKSRISGTLSVRSGTVNLDGITFR